MRILNIYQDYYFKPTDKKINKINFDKKEEFNKFYQKGLEKNDKRV
jgi:hypothetical protein